MKFAPTTPTEAMRDQYHDLVNVCDDLLSACGHLRKSAEAGGKPWPVSEAARIIDRVLDARISLYRALDLPLPKVNGASGSMTK